MVRGPSIFDRLSKLVSGEKVRKICCFSCGHRQEVSSAAQSSLCPSCGSYIDLRDLKISGSYGRSIQTQGEIHLTSKGELTSAKAACGSAIIEGKLRGSLVCNGEVRLRAQGKVMGGIEAHELVVEKKCDVECVRVVKAHSMEINGKISARVVCETAVVINKGGFLEGSVYARSISVEKGGFFTGELFIGQPDTGQAGGAPGVVPKQQGLFGESDFATA